MDKPKLFAAGTEVFWTDEHISKALLEAHLNPDIDAASRQFSFLDKSVAWIAKIVPPKQYTNLLDLGCGPGLYAEQFAKAGYIVTGLDYSKRSIAYANEQTQKSKSDITYRYQNYLTMDFDSEFDVAALIYCDFGALSTADRRVLASKIHKALKPGGKLILDLFTPRLYLGRPESRSWQYNENGGFWSKEPHICFDTVYHYDEDTTELRQSIVQTEESVKCYNIWEHFFTKENLLSEMQIAGFNEFELFGDVAGSVFSDNGDTFCGVFAKGK
jgi:SAM-dependent methyltransferase